MPCFDSRACSGHFKQEMDGEVFHEDLCAYLEYINLPVTVAVGKRKVYKPPMLIR